MLLPRLIEATFFLYKYPSMLIFRAPKSFTSITSKNIKSTEGFHSVNNHLDFLWTSSDKKRINREHSEEPLTRQIRLRG